MDKSLSDELVFRVTTDGWFQKDIADLLDDGANMYTLHETGDLLIQHALKTDRQDIVELFLERGFDLSITNNSGDSLLLHALNEKHRIFCNDLINKGACVSPMSSCGRNELHLIVIHGFHEMVSPILNNTYAIDPLFDIDIKSVFGYSAMELTDGHKSDKTRLALEPFARHYNLTRTLADESIDEKPPASIIPSKRF